jgi:predicted DNA-binding protein (MmcQ/YjbR family)
MILEDFNKFCSSLTSTTKVIQWGNAHVWKIGGKIFAIASYWGPNTKNKQLPEEGSKISFKCSDFSYSILIEQQGIIPAPYLARAKWVQLEESDALNDEDVKSYITQAHSIIAAKLTKKLQAELGI